MPRFILLLASLLLVFTWAVARDQEPLITPGDNLVLDGIPPLPVSLAAAVGRYTEFRSATFTSWHPTRREMLIVTRFADVPQLHRVQFPGGARTQLTFFPERVGGGIVLPEGRRVLRLLEGCRRRRMVPALPLRFCHRRRDAPDGREVPQHLRGVVHGGRPHGVRLNPAER